MISVSDRVSRVLSASYLPSITSKLTIGNSDVYLKLAWMDGNVVNIDINLSTNDKEVNDSSYHLARSWVEDSCRMASMLLQRGVEIGEITKMWRGVEGFPNGFCPQIGGIMRGPLHAVAIRIDDRIEHWTDMISISEASRKEPLGDG